MTEKKKKKTKRDDFHIQDLVLNWDARIEDKGKHGKFDHLWKGLYQIATYHGKNVFILQELNRELLKGGLVDGSFSSITLLRASHSIVHIPFQF